MSSFTESVVEDAALSWLGGLEYSALHGPEIAPGELLQERAGFVETVAGRFRASLRKLNPAALSEALEFLQNYRAAASGAHCQ